MARVKDLKRRSLILDNALELFAQRGYHAVSVKDIAETSDISLGSMYTYFDSKEHLANELFRLWKQNFATAASLGVEGLRGRAAHRQVWNNIGRFIADNPKAFGFLESQMHSTYLDQESVNLEVSLTKSMIGFYCDSLELGLEPSKAQLIISATFGAYVQVFKAAKSELLQYTPELREELEKLAWRMASTD